jgi:FKBP-type peptidyl-prolyl cis-trans isomerase (trigger factor)
MPKADGGIMSLYRYRNRLRRLLNVRRELMSQLKGLVKFNIPEAVALRKNIHELVRDVDREIKANGKDFTGQAGIS